MLLIRTITLKDSETPLISKKLLLFIKIFYKKAKNYSNLIFQQGNIFGLYILIVVSSKCKWKHVVLYLQKVK